jgi:hypothetical protein
MSPEQLDDLAGLPRGSVEAYELTQREITLVALRDLARALGVSVSALVPNGGGWGRR